MIQKRLNYAAAFMLLIYIPVYGVMLVVVHKDSRYVEVYKSEIRDKHAL